MRKINHLVRDFTDNYNRALSTLAAIVVVCLSTYQCTRTITYTSRDTRTYINILFYTFCLLFCGKICGIGGKTRARLRTNDFHGEIYDTNSYNRD